MGALERTKERTSCLMPGIVVRRVIAGANAESYATYTPSQAVNRFSAAIRSEPSGGTIHFPALKDPRPCPAGLGRIRLALKRTESV